MNDVRLEYLADYTHYLPELAQWYHKEWNSINPDGTLEKRIQYLTPHLQKRAVPTTFVALRGDTLVGGASLTLEDMDTHMHLTPWLANVLVTPDFRNRGLGSRLVQRIVEEARQLKEKKLYLFTPDREHFYLRMGWKTIERPQYREKQVVVMELEL